MPIRCLVVEDEFFTRDVLSLTLRRANMEVDLVTNGAEAIAYLEHTQPDVVIADLHMPGTNGYDLINYIRHDATLQHLVIMVITANPSAIGSAEAKMADAFLTKPLDIKRLITMIESLISAEQSS